MSDEKKKNDPSRAEDRPETFFLPPLKMILAFFDKESEERKQKQDDQKQEEKIGKNLERLIEKLSEKEK